MAALFFVPFSDSNLDRPRPPAPHSLVVRSVVRILCSNPWRHGNYVGSFVAFALYTTPLTAQCCRGSPGGWRKIKNNNNNKNVCL
jgi:hypothetical protein